ncbi:hypothetical protein AMECASPLE_020537 [Ameca splendens]|uniref:Uncharacterized protein n=1 Tax=Ameca splendens TaxID=208324 RepID=A0ABV0YFF5_9TELE
MTGVSVSVSSEVLQRTNRHGCPPKLTDWAKRAFIRDAAKRTMVTLEERQRSTALVGDFKSIEDFWTSVMIGGSFTCN